MEQKAVLLNNDTRIEKFKNIHVLKYSIFDDFTEDLLAVYTTRSGGVSEGIFKSLNLSLKSSDSFDAVKENYAILTNTLNIDPNNLVISNQGNKNGIRIISESDKGKGLFIERDYDDVDGLITSIPNIVLATLHADCSALYIYDPIKKVIGLAHAGWKGTTLEIASKMVRKMTHHFSSNPKDLKVAISPSICQECYEVDEAVKLAFDKIKIDVSGYIRFNENNNKYYPDINQINQQILIYSGVLKNNIQIANICTMENKDLFFSHRGHKGKRGSNAALLQLKSKEKK